ncbi:SusD/RagB family nutrient-binding outer membrane lipoprotein [Maribacter sp.]|uniref:SusD/RagB family nutrient-binding outer membrane lipoprotein n=1 Tax=Maribacter sp. TaxID=1897614 RepID=UPI0025BA0CB3|nr:SusD/RagB family nutrient-binding outer membrane lipoprotein [Maribacter sp.]
MNLYIKRIFLASFFLFTFSCDDDFAELNTDPNKAGAEVFDANLILPNVIYNSGNNRNGYSGAVLFQVMWVQLMASTSTGGANYYSNADKYVASGSTNSYIGNFWFGQYSTSSRAKQLEKLATEKGLTNLASIGKIMQIQDIGFISDVYGDVPYAEALQADEGLTAPSYQLQSSLYPEMLADLETAILTLNDEGDKPTNDILYDGDISKWRKFGYSLMLKFASRLVKVDAATAQTFITKALNGGIFDSPEDDAFSPMDEANGFTNSTANAFNVVDDLYEVRWSKTFVDYLKATNDPRLTIVAEIPLAGLAGNKDLAAGDSDPALQLGLPNGFDLKGGATDVANAPGFPGSTGMGDDLAPIGNYSRPTAIYRNREVPTFILTYSQVQLLLADAAARGLTVPGSASDYYNEGVTAAMATLNKMGGAQINPTDASAYAIANPLDTSSSEASLKMINEQYWASTGMIGNFVEAWNNWKRSDYPVLTPVNYSGNFSGGKIPVRQPYPSGEEFTNTENYKEAIGRIGGPNDWTTKVWWDVN